jgi:beta-galactosidase
LRFGVSYYPELVDESEWAGDLDNMARAGLKVIRMLEFAWSSYEPREGEYRWDWVDRFVELAGERGFELVLCTPTATPPAWLISQYPQIMVELRDGRRRTFGARRDADLSSPIYRAYAREAAEVLGRRYGQCPAVIGWQIDNELMGPEAAPPESHSPEATFRFRQWLKRRYGTVDKLNAAWGMGFWSQEFSDWGEVITPRYPRVCRGWIIDYQRFFSDENVEFIKLQYDALRAHIDPRQWISHNSTGVFNLGISHADYARALDVAGWDAYLGAAAAGHPFPEAWTAMACDWLRAARQQPLHIYETSAGGQRASFAHVAEMRAHGADMVLYWHWRGHRFNVEQGTSSICDFAGRPFEERLNFTRTLAERPEFQQQLPNKLPPRSAALIFSLDCVRHAIRGPFVQAAGRGRRPSHNAAGTPYLESIIKLYQPFWQKGIGIDLVEPGQDLSPYALVLMPSVELLDRSDAEPIRQFVGRGGVLIATAKTAHKDSLGVFHRTLGEPLADVLGISMRTDLRLREGPRIAMADGGSYQADAHAERLDEADGEILGHFADGELAGRAAVLRRSFGKGKVWYLAAPCVELARDLAGEVASAAGLEAAENPHPAVSVCPDAALGGTWYINHSDGPLEVAGRTIPAKDYVFA